MKTPRTVSKLLPTVSINEPGAVTVNEQGATQVHHTLGVPGVPMPSEGSPPSDVAKTTEPVAVSVPDPVIGSRLTNASLDGVVMYVKPFSDVPD